MEKVEKKIEQLQLKVEEQERKIKLYEEQIRYLTQQRFGSKSEKTNPDQLSFFNEVENETNNHIEEPEIETEKIEYTRKKKSKKRVLNLDNFPTEEIHYELSGDEKVCPCCEGKLHDMGADVSSELKIIPAKAIVVKHYQHKYACRRCEQENTKTPIIKAKAPVAPIPKSIASPSLISHIACQKYSEGMPLYRQEKYLSNLGINISRQNMANWIVQSSSNWFSPVYDRMHELLVAGDIINADETPLQVLRENGREAKSKSYMWLYRTGGRTTTPIVLYEYQPTRAQEHPEKFLQGFSGYLQTDGYAGYNNVKGITRLGCMAHARRKFKEVVDISDEGTSTSTNAAKGLMYCNELFKIEREIADLDSETRLSIRQEKSSKVLLRFHQWLIEMKDIALNSSKLGKAINYALNQWDTLISYIEDERLEISNNIAERSIKPFVIGRKNWLFSNTPKGATASATIYSIVETAKENGLIPFEYINFLLETIPNMELTKENIDQVLPWSGALPEKCYTPKKKEKTPN